ncbi:MAG: PH domain-containing protein [Alphaproteobacteria bacterium]
MTSDETFPPEAIPSGAALEMAHTMLLPGENLLHVATISRGIYWKAAFMAALGFAVAQFSYVLAGYFFLIAFGLLVMAYMTKKYLLLATTDHRVIIRAGVVNQERLDLRHSKIESIELLRTLPGMIFGYGSIILSGTGNMRILIPFVEDASAFRDNLTQKLLEREIPLPSTPYVARPARDTGSYAY